LDDGEGGQTLSPHVDDHVDGEVEAEQEVRDAKQNDEGYEVPIRDKVVNHQLS